MLAAAVRGCPDGLWQEPMWEVQASEIVGEVRDAGGRPVTDPAQRDALVQRWSAPWSVAWHALEVLDYDLAGEPGAWAPPPPFAGKPHWQTFTSLPVPWSQAQTSEYVDYCRRRVDDGPTGITEEKASALLPPAHRYQGRPYAGIVTSLGHVHGSGVRWPPHQPVIPSFTRLDRVLVGSPPRARFR